jgi:hypothetical protein
MAMTFSRSIVVAGDVVTDHHHYEAQRPRANNDLTTVVRAVQQKGGAAMLRDLIAAVMCKEAAPGSDLNDRWTVKPEHPRWPDSATKRGVHAYGVWRPYPQRPGKTGSEASGTAMVWRLANQLGYGDREDSHEPLLLRPPEGDSDGGVLVLDDAGLGFRSSNDTSRWGLPKSDDVKPTWILLKMSGALARGELWQRLIKDYSDRLVCLISAEDLRRDELLLGPGLSWERTIEETGRALCYADKIRELGRCAHVVITFSCDGALWINQTKVPAAATLFFDAESADGEFITHYAGGMIGFQTAMAAALARGLAAHVDLCCRQDAENKGLPALELGLAIRSGLTARRHLMTCGHGRVVEPAPGEMHRQYPPGYPVKSLTGAILTHTDSFAVAHFAWPPRAAMAPDDRGRWMMVEMSEGAPVRPSLFGIGCDILLRGRNQALKHFPHAKFGNLVSVDRAEIEALRNIRRLMTAFMRDPTVTKPLSIGVFGPPGAGKSFGVREIAEQVSKDVYGRTAWLEFNLSQFTPPADLTGALYRVGDQVLSGITPVVFWDEFDSRQFEWLKYLLAPMQDGRFQDGQVSHPVGKSVFIFAGGTSRSFHEFSLLGSGHDDLARKFIAVKGPDFRSRIDAYYDVLGPNQRLVKPTAITRKTPSDAPKFDAEDGSHVLRRALFIQSKLKTDAPLRDFDKGLMNALLRIPAYKNGARSLEKVVVPLLAGGISPVRRSCLPASSQLEMHVDTPERFSKLLNERSYLDLFADDAGQVDSDGPPRLDVNRLAKAVHDTWRALLKENNWTAQPRFDKEFDELAEVDQEDNRAAARRIPWILCIAGLDLKPVGTATPGDDQKLAREVAQQLAFHLERLAEFEHDEWERYRREDGWTFGKERNDAARIHPQMRPYDQLPEIDREKDRNTVRNIPRMVQEAGYRITWLQPDPFGDQPTDRPTTSAGRAGS